MLATVDKFITKKHKEAVLNVEFTVRDKIKAINSKVPSIDYPYFAITFKFLL